VGIQDRRVLEFNPLYKTRLDRAFGNSREKKTGFDNCPVPVFCGHRWHNPEGGHRK
jgi:hypothetical protein